MFQLTKTRGPEDRTSGKTEIHKLTWKKNTRTGDWESSNGRWEISPAYEPSIRGGSVSRPSHWIGKDRAGRVGPFSLRYLSEVKEYCVEYDNEKTQGPEYVAPADDREETQERPAEETCGKSLKGSPGVVCALVQGHRAPHQNKRAIRRLNGASTHADPGRALRWSDSECEERPAEGPVKSPNQERHDADYTVAVQMAESDVVRGEWYRISDWAKSRPEYPGRQNSDRVVQVVAIVYRESRPPHVAFNIPQVDRRNNLRWAHSALPMSDFRRIYQPVGPKHVNNEESQQ